MVRRLCICAVLLASLVIASGAQTQTGTLYQQPQGELFQRLDGSHGYIVSQNDRVGQWQVAFGSPQLWSELVKSNPQLADPDKIWPGDELNVPPSLVRLFSIMKAVNEAGGPHPLHNGSIPPTLYPPDVSGVQTTTSSWLPWWLWVFLTLAAAYLLTVLVYVLRERRRIYHNPYSGPPVREAGLPRPDDAVAHFTNRYRTERDAMSVAENRAFPPTVAIQQIREVDVRGPLMIRYAGSSKLQRRDITEWTPAWECTLSDGSRMYTLTACANDVRSGNGMSVLPETQVRARQGVTTVTPSRQIWPEVVDPQPERETPVEVPVEVVDYTSVKVTSPTRFVLHRTNGRESVVDVGVLAGLVTIAIEGGNILAIVGDQRRVIGRIVEAPAPTETTIDIVTQLDAVTQ